MDLLQVVVQLYIAAAMSATYHAGYQTSDPNMEAFPAGRVRLPLCNAVRTARPGGIENRHLLH